MSKVTRKHFALSFLLLVIMLTAYGLSGAKPVEAATWYVDPAVSGGSHNGTSWANAWTSLASTTGVSAGDTVYLSGGTNSQIYSMTSVWSPAGGTTNTPITYKAGQDAGHNGTVIFDGGGRVSYWITPSNWTTVDGGYNGNRNIVIQNYTNDAEYVNATDGSIGLVFRYITFPAGDAFHMTDSSYYEIGYCYMHATYDHAITLGGSNPVTITWDTNKIHHNTFILDNDSAGSGDGCDGIQWGQSLSVYNNLFVGNPAPTYLTTGGGQHQDGWQMCGQYTRFYNNTVQDMANYGVFGDCFGGTADSMQVFNNVFYQSDTQHAGGYQQAVSIGRDGGASGTQTFTNILVMNNTVSYDVDGPDMQIGFGSPVVFNSTDQFYNNVAYENYPSQGGFAVNSSVAGYNSSTNVTPTSGGANLFVTFQTPTGTPFAYNFALKSTASVLIGHGTNLTSLGITTLNSDIIGTARPSSGAWDIGAYESTGLVAPTGVHLVQ